MAVNRFFQKGFFVLRIKYLASVTSFFRKTYYSMLGMHIGKGTKIPKMDVTWPHQVYIGKNCQLERNIFFKYDGVWTKGKSILIEDNVFIGANCEFNSTAGISIGAYGLIASGCKFIDHNHGTSITPNGGRGNDVAKEIILANNVWLGVNVVVLMGVEIGEGAIVAAGAVVTKSIPPYEIWGGIPARKIGTRK